MAEPTLQSVVIADESLRRLEGFTQLPNAVLKHPKLKDGAKIAYGVLLSYAWQKDFCFPAQERLAADMSCTVRTVQRHLAELEKNGLIRTIRQGLNRPNRYEILALSSWTNGSGDGGAKALKNKDATNLSHPDTTEMSRQDTTRMSYKEDSSKHTQSTGTGREKIPKASPSHSRTSRKSPQPIIRWAVLKSKYGLDDRQCGLVERLVELQSSVLGEVGQNHSLYVQRAAEATRDGNNGKLEMLLRNAEEDYHRKPPRTNRSREFHGRWKNFLADQQQQTADPVEIDKLRSQLGAAKSWPADQPEVRDDSLDPRERQRRRYLEDLLNRGYRVPASIARASLPEIAAWADQEPIPVNRG